MSNRHSQIRKVLTDDLQENSGFMYVVDLYEKGSLIQSRQLPGKSIHYAEDVAENWNNGLIQLLTE